MVFWPVEVGLQRGTLVMQPANSKSRKLSDLRKEFTRRGGLTMFNILFKNKDDQRLRNTNCRHLNGGNGMNYMEGK
jgi:hypothetical protein